MGDSLACDLPQAGLVGEGLAPSVWDASLACAGSVGPALEAREYGGERRGVARGEVRRGEARRGEVM